MRRRRLIPILLKSNHRSGLGALLVASTLFAGAAHAAPLKVVTMGLGSGTVTSSAGGINCNENSAPTPDCEETYGSIMVTLTATPAPGSTFGGWDTDVNGDTLSTSDCTGMALTCPLNMATAKSVRPVFNLSTPIPTLTAADPTAITPVEIQNYLNANPTVDTVAEFVAALPAPFKYSPIMMTRSESLQTGTAEHPRILLSSINAKSVFSIGPVLHSAYPGSHPDVIEYMQWDAGTNNFRFHEIILKPIPPMAAGAIPARVRKVEEDDVKCSSCHSTRNVLNRSTLPGTDGMPVGVIQTKNKPNWDPYDSWGGMMPLNRDRLYQGSLDAAAYRKLYNPWTWRNSHAIRSLVEQLRLQPPSAPASDRITRFRGGANDGTPRFPFDATAPITTEPVPTGTMPSITTAYNFDNTLLGTATSVTRGGSFVTLYHHSPITTGEGRGVQLFDLLGGLDGDLNQRRVADELASHRWATGNVFIDPRPVALAITKNCLSISGTNVVSSFGALTFDQNFFTARHGGNDIDVIRADTDARAKSVPRRKVDIQRFNLDRTGDEYLLTSGGPVNGLVQQYGAATSSGTDASFPRLRREVFRRFIDDGNPDATSMLGIFVDREFYTQNTTPMALYRYLLEPLGISVDKWSMGVRGRSRTYAFADIFPTYTNALRNALEANLTADPIPGLTAPYACGALIPFVNSTLASLPGANDVPTYTDVQRIFNKSCVECHGGLNYPPYFNHGTALNLAEDQSGPLVNPLAASHGDALSRAASLAGPLYSRITSGSEACPFGMMPCGGPPLSQADIDTIRRWIVGGNPSTWGDPHLTTIDGVRYDFQSAGEFVLLRDPSMEIQARHMPVTTAGPVGPDAHTGLTSCVSIMTAVAVRVGPNRVTYQLNPQYREGMELRVNGRPVQLGTELLLAGGGRIVRTPSQGGIQIEGPGGTRIIITVDWWAHYQVYYMNVSVEQARATEGILGPIARGNWLPTLSDGTQLGARPTDPYQRYVQLYEKFEESWRVTDASSLFDYLPGFSTASYTLEHWPAYKADTCKVDKAPAGIPIREALPPIPMDQAFELCRAVQNEERRMQCAQDVAGTGDPIFAHTFAESERVQANNKPGITGLVSPRDAAVASATMTFNWASTFDKDQDTVLYRHCVWSVDEDFTFQTCSQPTRELARTVTLEPGKAYLWKVLAEDGKGGSTESHTWRVTAKR
jgi:hypothetical protein